MVIDHPKTHQIPQLRQLWKLAFGDADAFLDCFFSTAFSPQRCRCITEGAAVTAVLYWFDCVCHGRKYAYLYAVATHPEHRNRGLCRALMADTHDLLREKGYDGAVLVPQEEALRRMYAAFGYRDATTVSEFTCVPAEEGVPLRKIGEAEYAALRRQYLPCGGVIQEGESLAFLARTGEFYAGEDFLLTASREQGFLWGMELLGNREAAPGILKTLSCVRGRFRTTGAEMPFAMFQPLTGSAGAPLYFGLAFD